MGILTIVLSGPRPCEQQARTVLASAGHNVLPTSHQHGLPDTVGESAIGEAQGFITVEGEDIDAAHSVVAPLGWRLRMHFNKPEPAPLSTEQALMDKLATLEQRLAVLEGR